MNGKEVIAMIVKENMYDKEITSEMLLRNCSTDNGGNKLVIDLDQIKNQGFLSWRKKMERNGKLNYETYLF